MKKIIALFLIVLLLLGTVPANAQGIADMSVYFIDCGQGDAIFIVSEGKTMLVDAGKAKNVQNVLDFLNSKGINKLDYVFSSHPDEDHIGGMPAIYENYQVNNSIYPSYAAQTNIYRKYMDAIKNEPNSVDLAADNKDAWRLGDAQITVLSDGKNYSDPNDASVVLKVSCGETSLLLTGDISQSVEKDLVQSKKNLDIDILKVGHHGSATSSSAAFLQATSPKVAVISVGEGNSYGHPTKAALNRLSAVCANIYRTDRDGTVLLEVADDQITYNKSILENADVSYCSARTVYVTASGSKYHASATCSNMKSPIKKTLREAKAAGYGACSKCVPSDFETGNQPHTFGDYVYNNDATTEKDGTKTRTCTACNKAQTITAAGTKLSVSFGDVKKSAYYYDAVIWAVEEEITNGMGVGIFAPDTTCTRGQIVTFLWRAAGKPTPSTKKNPFKDVNAGAYYYDAVLWAVEKGITTGTSANTFSPDAACTRGQVVTFLWRAGDEPAAGGTNSFKDVKANAYYYDAVIWAVKNQITNGMDVGIFAPDASCTRGQIVTFLFRTYN